MIDHHIHLNFSKEELKELDHDFKKLQDDIANKFIIGRTKQIANAMVALDDYDPSHYKFVTPYDKVDTEDLVAGFDFPNKDSTYTISFILYYKGEPIEKALANRFKLDEVGG